jgi:hypothetical protein
MEAPEGMKKIMMILKTLAVDIQEKGRMIMEEIVAGMIMKMRIATEI